MYMTPLGYVMMYGWFLVVVPGLFLVLPKRTAAFSGLIFGWLFLPFGAKVGLGPMDITRDSAVCLSVVACMLVLDLPRVMRVRLSWIDIPIFIWVISPFFTSMTNGLGAYDGGAEVKDHLMVWGLPYFIGRVYVTDAKAAKHLAMILIVAALVYVPFVLWEIRFSPRLHKAWYGYTTYDHGGTALRRLGGWRPLVFMRHGLMLGVFMAVAALLASWLWFTRSVRQLPLLPPGWRGPSLKDGQGMSNAVPFLPIVLVLVFIALACRALNGLGLMLMGGAVLAALFYAKTRVPLALMALIPILYVGMRLSEHATGFAIDQPAVSIVSKISQNRADSLEFRFDNERLLLTKAMQRPMLGWGGWGRNRVYDEDGNDLTVTDGYWIITLGQTGLIGLAGMYMTLLGPVFVLIWRYDAKVLSSAEGAAATGLAVAIVMYSIDSLPNAMLNPMFPMAAGGLAALMVTLKRPRKGRARARVPLVSRSMGSIGAVGR